MDRERSVRDLPAPSPAPEPPVDRFLEILQDLNAPKMAARLDHYAMQGIRLLEHLDLPHPTPGQLEFTHDDEHTGPPSPIAVDQGGSKPKQIISLALNKLKPTRSNSSASSRKLRKPRKITTSSDSALSPNRQPLNRASSPLKPNKVLRQRSSTIATSLSSIQTTSFNDPSRSNSSLETGSGLIRRQSASKRFSLGNYTPRAQRMSIFGKFKSGDPKMASAGSMHSEDGDDERVLFMSPVTSRSSDRASPISTTLPSPIDHPANGPHFLRWDSSDHSTSASISGRTESTELAQHPDQQDAALSNASKTSTVHLAPQGHQTPAEGGATWPPHDSLMPPSRRKFSTGNWSLDSASSRHSWVPDVQMGRLSLLYRDPVSSSADALPIYDQQTGPSDSSHSLPTSYRLHTSVGSGQTTGSLPVPTRGFSSSDLSEAESSDLPTAASASENDEWHDALIDGGSALTRKESTRTATCDNIKVPQVTDRPLLQREL